MTIATKFARRLCTLLAAFGLMLRLGNAQAQTVIYYHTDALGSPVATTDASGNVIERSEYEPYGKLLSGPLKDGPGYTGHVSDAETGLSYMQQRYYDPQIGRFLSMDPVAADANTGGNFNRYKYASNNPYRYVDPDGRVDWEKLGDSFKIEAAGGLGLQAKVKIGPIKVSGGLGEAVWGGGVTIGDAYGFQEVSGPSLGVETKRFGVGYHGSRERSEEGRHDQLFTEQKEESGWMVGVKKAELQADDGGSNAELSATASFLVVKLTGSADLGKAWEALTTTPKKADEVSDRRDEDKLSTSDTKAR